MIPAVATGVPLVLYNALLGTGGSKFALFARLNISARNCSRAASEMNRMGKLRLTE